MKRVLFALMVVAISCPPTFAQSNADLVAAVKTALQAQGANLSGPCGAFAITKHVAWQLRGEGAGLLSKPAGNNCEGYSVDYVVYPTGRGADILGDAGGANTPAWNEETDPDFIGRWRPPSDPDGSPPPPVVVVPAPIPAPIFSSGALDDLLQRQMRIENQTLIITAEGRETRALAQEAVTQIKEHRAGVQSAWLKVAAVGGPVISAVLTWLKMKSQ